MSRPFDELEQAVALGPVAGIDRLHAIIGRLHLGRNDLDAAIEADRQWTLANPNDVNAHRALGDAYRLQDRFPEALAEYAAALLIDPRGRAGVYGDRPDPQLPPAGIVTP